MSDVDNYTKPVLPPQARPWRYRALAMVTAIPQAIAFIPLLLQDRADELRFSVDLYRAQALHDGCPPDQVARIGALELGWADFLDALGGRRS